MGNLNFLNIMLIILVIILFITSRNALKKAMTAVKRAGRLEKMIQKVLKYGYEGKDKSETIENLMKDFNLGEREAEYLYNRAMKQKKEEDK